MLEMFIVGFVLCCILYFFMKDAVKRGVLEALRQRDEEKAAGSAPAAHIQEAGTQKTEERNRE